MKEELLFFKLATGAFVLLTFLSLWVCFLWKRLCEQYSADYKKLSSFNSKLCKEVIVLRDLLESYRADRKEQK